MTSVTARPAKAPDQPLDEADLRRWPWGISWVELLDGLALVRSRHPHGFTVDDLDVVPDDGRRHELLDGVIVVSPSPSRHHQRVVTRLAAVLVAAETGEAQTLVAPLDVRLALGTRVQPDVVVLPTGGGELPSLVVEVLSPSSRRYDLGPKRMAYQQAGVPTYWLVDPEEPALTVLELDDSGRYVETVAVRGDEPYVASQPFALRLTPAELLR
jgi:Uma2 family endonuclease